MVVAAGAPNEFVGEKDEPEKNAAAERLALAVAFRDGLSAAVNRRHSRLCIGILPAGTVSARLGAGE
jgi:hypothetical protein